MWTSHEMSVAPFTQLYRGQYTLSFQGALQVTRDKDTGHAQHTASVVGFCPYFLAVSHDQNVSLNSTDSKRNETLIHAEFGAHYTC